MPFYEYLCKNCGHELEAMQKVSDAPLKKCPDCGKPQLERLMSAPVFRLKGGGWYETDFKGDKDNKRNIADRPEVETAKEADGKAKDDKGKDGKDAKAAESKAPDAAPAKESSAQGKVDKAVEKSAPAGAARKPRKKPLKIKRRR
jgi:putative FmdB family regulatory protein